MAECRGGCLRPASKAWRAGVFVLAPARQCYPGVLVSRPPASGEHPLAARSGSSLRHTYPPPRPPPMPRGRAAGDVDPAPTGGVLP